MADIEQDTIIIKNNVPIYEKQNLTVEEASMYSNIGENKLRELIKNPLCEFSLTVGRKTLIKRKAFDRWVEDQIEI